MVSVFDFAAMQMPFIFKIVKRISDEHITRPQAIVTEETVSDLLITPLKANRTTAICSMIKLFLRLSAIKASATPALPLLTPSNAHSLP
jgi:hypothetical protein